MIRALIWKEWCQLRWKLVFACVIALTFICVGLRARILPDEIIIVFCLLGSVCLMPVFVGMGLFAEEVGEGSLFMQVSLAVETKKVYVVKILVGIAVCLVPVVLSMIVAMVTVGGREVSTGKIVHYLISSMPFVFSFLLWTTTFGIRFDSEAKVALLALGIGIGWTLVVAIDDMFLRKTVLNRISLVVTPVGFLEYSLDGGRWIGMLVMQTIISVGMFLWGMKRFCKLAGGQR